MKKHVKQNNKKRMLIIIGILAAAIVGVLTLTTNKVPSAESVETTKAGDLVIKKADITNVASFIPYESNGTYMELIAVRAADGSVRTALNTCQVCYTSGRGYYEQLGENLICNNCGNQFTINQIELQKGGCNPVPILNDMKLEDADTITVKSESLSVYEPLFAYWKR